MKKLTSITTFMAGEGRRVVYTYSEVDESGRIISQNNRDGFVADGALDQKFAEITKIVEERMDV